MVMVGHLVHADLTEPGRPASLSTRAVQGLLRTTLAYDGVVISDDMQMGALTRFFLPSAVSSISNTGNVGIGASMILSTASSVAMAGFSDHRSSRVARAGRLTDRARPRER